MAAMEEMGCRQESAEMGALRVLTSQGPGALEALEAQEVLLPLLAQREFPELPEQSEQQALQPIYQSQATMELTGMSAMTSLVGDEC